MREFFRGWKRKAGCVTLLMGCTFAAAWVRSKSVSDSLHFPVNRNTVGEITSGNEGIYLLYHSSLRDLHGVWGFKTEDEKRAFVGNFFRIGPERVVEWVIDGYGFYGGESHGAGGDHRAGLVIVPHWFTVLPLTLLSAWLLLSKPCSEIPRTVIEPAPITGDSHA